MTTTKAPDAGAPPTTARARIAAILAIIDPAAPPSGGAAGLGAPAVDSGATRRYLAARLSPAVGGIAVLEIVFRRHDQEIAWRAFERLLQGGHQDVQIRVDEHGWIVRVAITTEVDAAPGVSRG